jgi:ubiquinol-cytochrome c reductase cytochrome c subunit
MVNARAIGLLILSMAVLHGAHGAEPEVNPATGRHLFLAYGCYECHGTTGAGGGAAGPRLAPNPLPLAAIEAKLRTASGRMPVYAPSVLADSQIAAIAAYLRSIPQGKPSKDIPLLNIR